MGEVSGLGHYRLTADRRVVPFPIRSPDDLIAWAREVWGDDDDRRRVDFTEVGPGITVSTVFLGIDHSFGRRGPPLVFETMTFDDYGGDYCRRWSTWDEAVAGHAEAVAVLRARTGQDADAPKAP